MGCSSLHMFGVLYSSVLSVWRSKHRLATRFKYDCLPRQALLEDEGLTLMYLSLWLLGIPPSPTPNPTTTTPSHPTNSPRSSLHPSYNLTPPPGPSSGILAEIGNDLPILGGAARPSVLQWGPWGMARILVSPSLHILGIPTNPSVWLFGSVLTWFRSKVSRISPISWRNWVRYPKDSNGQVHNPNPVEREP